ncbi:hypothetical protein DKX38_016518 [Salix brachista]|uniref:Uncharacterized protein n=1 Tax=Salix brachista TaxID=2182728 RepID=A0A5N5L888_9ROSI|nr:hypothetical protein DKX38_016518 [Salix brachista]
MQPISSSLSLSGGGTDRLSLLALKAQITGDPLGALSSWNESLHFCEWSGVTCGRRHHRAVELDLHSCKLAGSLSPHIGNLSFLRILDLSNNSFSQNIPQELGRLFRLLQLNLENNTFTGEIPANISYCSNLQLIDLRGNDLIGKIPVELGSLLNLQACLLTANHLVGEIPLSFENLSSVESIRLGDNHLQGSLPYGIGRLKRLKKLSVPINNLSGTIPPSMYNLSSLTFFSVAINQFHGSLPSDLGQKLPSLEVLLFYANKFNGPIPVTIFNASTLSRIDLGNNSFTGKVPPFPNLPNLQHLYIDSNELGNGEEGDLIFLHSLANCTNLEVLVMGDNNLVEETSCTASDTMRRIGNNKALECLVSIMEVGVSCSEEVPRERTNISHAVAELLRIRDILLGTRRHGQRTCLRLSKWKMKVVKEGRGSVGASCRK